MNDEFVSCYSPFCRERVQTDKAIYVEGKPYCSEDCKTLVTEIDEKTKDLLKKIPVQVPSGFRIY